MYHAALIFVTDHDVILLVQLGRNNRRIHIPWKIAKMIWSPRWMTIMGQTPFSKLGA